MRYACLCRFAVTVFLSFIATGASASELVNQRALPGRCVPKFATPLPMFGPGPAAALPRVDAAAHPFLQISMKEIEQQVLPQGARGEGCPESEPGPTRVWTYETKDLVTGKLLGPAHWPAVTLDARRGVPVVVKYVNELPAFDPRLPRGPGLVQGLISIDQTIHWADPLGSGCMNMASMQGSAMEACMAPYVGPPPAVPHLHGGEVPSASDGNPLAWFTPDGRRGPSFGSLWNAGRAASVYSYPNQQEAGTLWFHDHALGATRTNVYGGLEAFYFLRDPAREPRDLPSGANEIELAIQDRQFDTEGQLFFPDGSGTDAVTADLNGTPANPGIHPLWIPEFLGDVVVVNGAPWPMLDVEPRRYRFRILDGSNARMWRLSFGGAPMWQVGADDALLDAPALLDQLFLAPGERADVVVDFSRLAGQQITVTNDAPVPFPNGLIPGDVPAGGDPTAYQPGMDQVLRIRVAARAVVADTSCDPAHGGCRRSEQNRIPRLTDGRGQVAQGVKIDRHRQLVLKEIAGFDAAGMETGPLEVLVNNSKFLGAKSPAVAAEFRDGVSELPRVGSTELWEIANLTADAHPMHIHLAQFQLLDRRPFDLSAYDTTWDTAFGKGPVPLPAGCVAGQSCPGYGPPLPYLVPNADGAVGGNPAFSSFFVKDAARLPEPGETGWKDTLKAHHGEVLRVLVRFAPTTTAVKDARAGQNRYPFDPTAGPGYVWHCHIIDHEDNDMMRPYALTH